MCALSSTNPGSCDLWQPDAQWYCPSGNSSCSDLDAAWAAWDSTQQGWDDWKQQNSERISGMVFNTFIFLQVGLGPVAGVVLWAWPTLAWWVRPCSPGSD